MLQRCVELLQDLDSENDGDPDIRDAAVGIAEMVGATRADAWHQ